MTREQTSTPVLVDRELVSRSFRVDRDGLPDLLAVLPDPRIYWNEPDQPPLFASGAAACIRVESDRESERFERVRNRARTLFENLRRETSGGPDRTRPILIGGFSFHLLGSTGDDWHGFPPAQFVLPRIQWTVEGDSIWVTLTEEPGQMETLRTFIQKTLSDENGTTPGSSSKESEPHIQELRQRPGRKQWLDHVDHALKSIASSELRKVVLAQSMRVEFDRPLTLPFLYNRLREESDPTFQFLIDSPTRHGSMFLGSSPELLVELDGRKLRTESLAGTVEAGTNDEEKETLASRLIESPKDRKEHDFVVSAIRDRLQPMVESIEIGRRTVRSLNSVQHLCTPVTAELREPRHVLSMVEALHPTPAVGGVPTDQALEFLRQHEPFHRGWYAGPVGWFDDRGRGRFTVGIRSAYVNGRIAHMYAGSGIVQHSEPESEWEEVQWKYKALLHLLQNS